MQQPHLVILGVVLMVCSIAPAAQISLDDPIVERCTVSVKEEIDLPAQDAGVLVEMNIEEGDEVEENLLVAKIDDTEADVQKTVAENARKRAEEQATSQVEIQYAERAAGVAEMTLKKAKEANERARAQGVSHAPYPEIEVERLRLDYERAGFQIEIAQMNQRLAKLDESARAAELKGAENALTRRRIIAPFKGQVVKLYRRKGEWVQPGDPILRLMHFDTMVVSGQVDLTNYNPSDVAGKNVTVLVKLAHDREITLRGKVKNIRPVLVDNKFSVAAEVANIEENGHWLVLDGAQATMTIHVK
ncbi:MAG: HlyD family efflux transporter periplasmic adaptor subunit [Pirellulales bacterium]|nr:HlyD family efflux transporter periplasmic adaptor subunit [Pirellulales bacterium]